MEPGDFAGFDPAAAQQFLRELPPETRRRGEQLHADGIVQDLRCVRPGEEYVADIQDGTLLQTTLSFDRDTAAWWEACSCTAGGGCEHAAGMMLSLLAEHSATSARSLSAGRKRRRTEERPTASGVLSRHVAEALDRALSRAESDFVRKVEERFAQLREKPTLTGDDLVALGIRATGNTWEKLDLWSSPPRDELEFWRHLALAAEERELPWPEFLRPVTDLTELRARVQAWRRNRDVERWRTLLGNLQLGPAEDARSADEVELRLRLTESEGLIEFRKPGALEWTPIKPGKFRDFDEKHGDQLAPEVALLWQPLAQRARYGHPVNLVYHDQQTRRLLNRLLRMPALERFLTGTDGGPLVRPEAPLRWQLDSAVDERDDYQLRLVQPDGAPAPRILGVLPGRPTLYLTSDAVWAGPPVEDHVLDPAAVTLIPAPSLETAPGVRFLHYLGVPLPARLAGRVETVSLEPVIQGELRAIAFGNDTEYAVMDALGLAPDAHYTERWNGTAWLEVKPAESGADPASAARPQTAERLVTFERNRLAEVPRLMEAGGFKWDFARQRWLLRITARFPEQFMAWKDLVPESVRLDLRGELGSFSQATVAGRVRLDVAEAGMDWFDLKVVLEVTDTQLTSEEVKVLLDARGKWVRLGTKGWRKLEFKLSPEEDLQLARLGINPHELTSEPQRFHTLQLADAAARSFVTPEKYELIRRRAAEIQARVTPEVPVALHAELRPYQREGFHFLCYLATNGFGGILADDMGLGKTLQTLAWLTWLRSGEAGETISAEPPVPAPARAGGRRRPGAPGPATAASQAAGNAGPVLVVCPKSVTDNWRAETARFAPHLRVSVWRSEQVKDLAALVTQADIHIINYNQLRMLGEDLGRIAFHAVILDEGQYIKNPSSITAQIARGLRARHRLVLSGTPIENRLLDLWSLMSFAMPGALGSRSDFARLFDTKGDTLTRQRLAARVRPFLLRRTKAQVARDLPDRIEEDLFCELEGEQRTLYRAELKRAQAMLLRVTTPAALAKHRFNFLTSLLRLRQICCHPRLAKPDSEAESAKTEALLETLEPLMEEGQKVLVFSQFVEMLDLLREAIAARGWSTYYLVGGTEKRGDLVRQFQAHDGAAVFLISLKAGGFGLNLTAASYVVLFDPWWNPAVEAQAIDRSHRIGQAQKVIAYRLLIKDSVEEKIRALQRQKSRLAGDILGEETFAQNLTLDDLQFLLTD
ncbi:MAG: DEAD/DEAH box helicase [Verrucomicrobiae bacterium]|nr:DEAD/DEAH box helicase [Verrucomicrobiae bacterium]